MNDCCPICLDTYLINNNTIKLECGHVFHKKCLIEWAKINPTCALCRKYLISKFKIYKTKHLFLKKFNIMEITDKRIEIYSINTNKIIVNPLFCIDILKKKEDIFGNKILKQHETLGSKIISIDIKNITKLYYSFNNNHFVLYYKINAIQKIYNFKCKKNNIAMIFNILKKNIRTIHNI